MCDFALAVLYATGNSKIRKMKDGIAAVVGTEFFI
jgi:hypothetical protein